MTDVDGSPAPDPGDEQAGAEQLDEEAVDLSDLPPERPLGVEGWGTTAVEEEGGESVRQRAAQEDPRVDLREEATAVAGLLQPDDDLDLDGDVTGESVAVEGDEPDQLGAEEAAVHVVEGPPPP